MVTILPGAYQARHVRFGRSPWWILALEGLALVGLGLLALIAPFIASLAVALFIGWICLLAGSLRIASAFTHRGPGFGWSIAVGMLALATGVGLVFWPVIGIFALTLLLSALLFADAGVSFYRAATVGRLAGHVALPAAVGVADLVLGAVVLIGLWHGVMWLLGLVVAANLIFAGAGLVAISLAWRGHHLTHYT